MRFFIVSLGLMLGATLASAQGDAKKGQELWTKYTCYGCHGFSGQNGPGLRLVPMRMTLENFQKLVRGPGNPRQMPPYSEKVISNEQLSDIWAYLKTLPDSPAVKDIPLLNSIANQK